MKTLRWRKARKVYRCHGGCDTMILPGDRYLWANWYSVVLIMPYRLCVKCGEKFEEEVKDETIDPRKADVLKWLGEAEPPRDSFMISAGQCYSALGFGEWRQKNETHPSGTLADFREWYRRVWKPVVSILTYQQYRDLGLHSPSGRRGLTGVFYFAVQRVNKVKVNEND